MGETNHAARALDQLEIAITRAAHQFAERIITKGHSEDALSRQLRDLVAVQNAMIQLGGMLEGGRLEALFALVQGAAGSSAAAHLVKAMANVRARIAIDGEDE